MGQIALHQELSHSFITNITVQTKKEYNSYYKAISILFLWSIWL